MNRSSQPSLAPALTQRLANVPWWLLVLILGGLFAVLQILTNERSTTIFTAISRGVVVTLRTTIIAYVAALVIGLTIGLARTSSNKLIYNLASFYVEVVRGIPMLVLLLYIAFVAVPLAMEGPSQQVACKTTTTRTLTGVQLKAGGNARRNPYSMCSPP